MAPIRGLIVKTREPRELVAFERAAQMLASAESFEDIKSIRDAAIAAQAYAKAARRGLETQNRVAVVRIQAERKAGKYLAGLKLRSLQSARTRTKNSSSLSASI